MLPLLLISSAALLIAGVIYYKNFYLGKKGNKIQQHYSELIYLLSGSYCAKEESLDARNFRLSYSADGGKHIFLLSEVDNRLIIVWNCYSRGHCTHSNEWSFGTGIDQFFIFGEISTSIFESKGELLSQF